LGFSLIKRRMPEVLSDAPIRIEPGQSIPLLILVKDAHLYPILLDSIQVRLLYSDGVEEVLSFTKKKIAIDIPIWHRIYRIQPRKDFFGLLKIDVKFKILLMKKPSRTYTFHTDNYRGSSRKPLQLFISKDPHPRFPNWHLGDLHVHSFFTRDQVEFGAPVQATAKLARIMGLSFFAVTDHSYDLDDLQDDYINTDPHLTKWKQLHNDADQIEKENKFVCIPGEEVSCRSAKGRNVHLLLFNNKEFFPGSGDSFEKWFKTRSELSLSEILQKIKGEKNVLAFAAHPEDAFTWIQRFLIRRGKWEKKDFNHSRLNGLQILNGKDDKSFRQGLRVWVQKLLEGKKLFIIAGNDAHGNFNRFRQLRLPFISLMEKNIHLFGWAKTAVIVQGSLTRNKVLESLAQGSSVITTGPLLNLEAGNQKGEKAGLGHTLNGSTFSIKLNARSSKEFGKITSCKLWFGDLENKKEVLQVTLKNFKDDYLFEEVLEINPTTKSSYIRGELNTTKQTFCFTNPIWLYAIH